MKARKKSADCDWKLPGFGSRVTSNVIAVNVKPQSRASTCIATDSYAR